MFLGFDLRPRVRSTPLFAAILAFAGIAYVATPASAATPSSATLSPSSPSATWTGSIFGAGSGESSCVDGVSCDSFQVVLAPGDYTGKQINLSVTWTVPAYDYDLYVHVGTLRGSGLPSSAGP